MSDDPYGGQVAAWAVGLADAVEDRYRGPARCRRREVADIIERGGIRLLRLRFLWKETPSALDALPTLLRAEAQRLPMGGQFQHLRHEASFELQQGIDTLVSENVRLQTRVNYLVACGYDAAIKARRAAHPQATWWRHLLARTWRRH